MLFLCSTYTPVVYVSTQLMADGLVHCLYSSCGWKFHPFPKHGQKRRSIKEASNLSYKMFMLFKESLFAFKLFKMGILE